MKLTAFWRVKNGECAACLKYSVGILLNKYIKCNIWRLAVRYDIYIYVIRRLKVNTGHTLLNCRIGCRVTWLRYPLSSSFPSHESRNFKSNHCHYNPLLFAVYFPSVSWSEMDNFRNWYLMGKYTWNELTDLGIAYGVTATVVWTGWERRKVFEARSLAVVSRTLNHAPPEHKEKLLTSCHIQYYCNYSSY